METLCTKIHNFALLFKNLLEYGAVKSPCKFQIFINKVRAVGLFSAGVLQMSDVIMRWVCSSKCSILRHYFLYFYRYFSRIMVAG